MSLEMLVGRKTNLDQIAEGVRRFIVGFGKKVLLANQVYVIWNEITLMPVSEISTSAAWLGALAFTFQIYFDFSGYSDMAIGLGKIFGFDYLENFNYPYISRSITEFWRRWHMSLSSWFKEYVYIPLGGNRKGLRAADSEHRRCVGADRALARCKLEFRGVGHVLRGDSHPRKTVDS